MGCSGLFWGKLYRPKIKEEGCIMKKLLALLMAVAVTFQLVTPVFADHRPDRGRRGDEGTL